MNMIKKSSNILMPFLDILKPRYDSGNIDENKADYIREEKKPWCT